MLDGVVVADASMWALLDDRLHVRRYEPGVNLWRDALTSASRLAGGRQPFLRLGSGVGGFAAAVPRLSAAALTSGRAGEQETKPAPELEAREFQDCRSQAMASHAAAPQAWRGRT